MKIKAKFIITPVGFFPAPLHPAFPDELANCETNIDLFELVEQNGFVNPDALNEVEIRNLYPEYVDWKKSKI